MNSEWFIFKGTHHIGPFTAQEIETMYKKGDITASILVWKEGEKSWEPLSKKSAFKYLVGESEEILSAPLSSNADKVNHRETSPNTTKKKLPKPIKANLNQVKNSSELSALVDDADDEVPPPLPMDVFKVDKVEKKVEAESFSETTVSDESVEHSLSKKERTTQFNKKMVGVKSSDQSRLPFIILVVCFVGVIIWQGFLSGRSDKNFKIKNLMPHYLDKLQNVAGTVSPNPKFGLALSMDGKTLYVASNRSGEVDISLKLTPIPKRVLGSMPSAIYLKGKLLNNLGEIDKVYTTEGDFSPGEYNYKLNAVERHFINTYFPALSAISFFKNLNKKYTVDGAELIYSGSAKEFEQKLQKYNQDLLDLKLKPLQERLERFDTILAIVDQMGMILEETLKAIPNGSEISRFEQVYNRETGVILQRLVTDGAKQDLDANNLIKLASEFYARIVTKTKKFKKLKPADRQALIKESNEEIASIKSAANSKITELKATIQSL